MQLSVNAENAGTQIQSIELPDELFSCELNEPLIHQVVTAYLAGGRSGTKAQKTRSQVKGGGIKPWRQKGTGRARVGSIRSPLWRGGGVAFAATPRSYVQKVNRKMYRSAMCAILSELIRQDRLKVIDSLALPTISTKELFNKLKKLNVDNVLIITDYAQQDSEHIFLSARNIPNVAVCDVLQVDPVSLISFQNVLLSIGTIQKLKERLS